MTVVWHEFTKTPSKEGKYMFSVGEDIILVKYNKKDEAKYPSWYTAPERGWNVDPRTVGASYWAELPETLKPRKNVMFAEFPEGTTVRFTKKRFFHMYHSPRTIYRDAFCWKRVKWYKTVDEVEYDIREMEVVNEDKGVIILSHHDKVKNEYKFRIQVNDLGTEGYIECNASTGYPFVVDDENLMIPFSGKHLKNVPASNNLFPYSEMVEWRK